MRKLSWWFRPHGLIYWNFDDLRDTGRPGVQFWRVFRKMLRTMQPAEGEGCVVEFQGERWQLKLHRSGKRYFTIMGHQFSDDWIFVAEEETFNKLKELVKKRIRPGRIQVYEYWAEVILCKGKTRYIVDIYRVRR